MASESDSQSVTIKELAYSNMLQVQSLMELLAEKGVLSQHEVLERVKRLQNETEKKRGVQ